MKKFLKFIKEKIIGLVIGVAIALTISATAATMFASSDVSYDNTNSGASATTVKEAFDELYDRVPEYYDPYFVGNTVYFNPETGAKCFDYVSENSLNNNKSGCMRWYIIGSNNDSVDLILDHNSSDKVAWNSSGTNASGPSEVLMRIQSDTSTWNGLTTRTDTYTDPLKGYTINYNGYKARLIEANEIAKITGADKALQWESDKPYGTTIGTQASWFYLDGKYGSSNIWQSQVSTSQGASKLAWLYDYTDGCASMGCNVEDKSAYRGYWTSSASANSYRLAWHVRWDGQLGNYDYGNVSGTIVGLRPVITIPKA